MNLLSIVSASYEVTPDNIEEQADQVLRFTAGFAEHPCAGLASAQLWDRQEVRYAAGEPRPVWVPREIARKAKQSVKDRQWRAPAQNRAPFPVPAQHKLDLFTPREFR